MYNEIMQLLERLDRKALNAVRESLLPDATGNNFNGVMIQYIDDVLGRGNRNTSYDHGEIAKDGLPLVR